MSDYKDKYQLFEYFKSVKNPNLCRESVFQKRFEDIYADFKNSIFYSLDFSFKERLYLYFLEIFTQDVNDLIKKFNDYYEQL